MLFDTLQWLQSCREQSCSETAWNVPRYLEKWGWLAFCYATKPILGRFTMEMFLCLWTAFSLNPVSLWSLWLTAGNCAGLLEEWIQITPVGAWCPLRGLKESSMSTWWQQTSFRTHRGPMPLGKPCQAATGGQLENPRASQMAPGVHVQWNWDPGGIRKYLFRDTHPQK